jgi:hypothetical protein
VEDIRSLEDILVLQVNRFIRALPVIIPPLPTTRATRALQVFIPKVQAIRITRALQVIRNLEATIKEGVGICWRIQ